MKQRKRRTALRALPVDTVWVSVVSLLPVLAAMPSRKKCPLDKYCRPKLCAILSHIVPFPDPGGPKIAARKNFAMAPTTKTNKQTLIGRNKSQGCSDVDSAACARAQLLLQTCTHEQ